LQRGLTQVLAALKWSTALVVLALAVPCTAAARCADGSRVFSGVVEDKRGVPVRGAVVGVAWNELEGAAGPSLGATDANGRYSVRIVFSTYSGKGRKYEDECKFAPLEASVSAYGGNLVSAARKVSVGPAEAVAVPPLRLTFSSSPDREPIVHLIRPGG